MGFGVMIVADVGGLDRHGPARQAQTGRKERQAHDRDVGGLDEVDAIKACLDDYTALRAHGLACPGELEDPVKQLRGLCEVNRDFPKKAADMRFLRTRENSLCVK